MTRRSFSFRKNFNRPSSKLNQNCPGFGLDRSPCSIGASGTGWSVVAVCPSDSVGIWMLLPNDRKNPIVQGRTMKYTKIKPEISSPMLSGMYLVMYFRSCG